MTLPKEAFMDSRSFPEMSCALCRKSVDLRTDLCTDENGKAIHEDCYLKHSTSNEGPAKLG
jgi:hypothetical protein